MKRFALAVAIAVSACGQPDATLRNEITMVVDATVPLGMPRPTPSTNRGTNRYEASWSFSLTDDWSKYREDLSKRLGTYRLQTSTESELVFSRAATADLFRVTITLKEGTASVHFVASAF